MNENNANNTLLVLGNSNNKACTFRHLDVIKYDRISPPSTSTLKRSTDIKLNLSKLLDKKACDTLATISGSNIKHNCTHINKHGVVINTESIKIFTIWEKLFHHGFSNLFFQFKVICLLG